MIHQLELSGCHCYCHSVLTSSCRRRLPLLHHKCMTLCMRHGDSPVSLLRSLLCLSHPGMSPSSNTFHTSSGELSSSLPSPSYAFPCLALRSLASPIFRLANPGFLRCLTAQPNKIGWYANISPPFLLLLHIPRYIFTEHSFSSSKLPSLLS